jgi:hypothetical protein
MCETPEVLLNRTLSLMTVTPQVLVVMVRVMVMEQRTAGGLQLWGPEALTGLARRAAVTTSKRSIVTSALIGLKPLVYLYNRTRVSHIPTY